ncbi:MAG: hypothetical protein CL535_16650 [Ahrensia sp.]|nr:hypothetical protein [Ahrensia sp.]MBV48206.1 hypothetical protein [Roseobacter sp.]MBV48307.1 hypothetical protein [Roseobacter sp.]|tara:strand:+ start:162548 stop:162784 length:237 start_codon:yes stop_codon:yes gene_type:complete
MNICDRLRGLSSEIAYSQIADQIVDEVAPDAADVIELLLAALKPFAQAPCTGPNSFNRAVLSDDDFRNARAAYERATQ